MLTALNISAGGMLALASATFFPVGRVRVDLTIGVAGEQPGPITRHVHAAIVRVENRPRYRLLGLKFDRAIA